MPLQLHRSLPRLRALALVLLTSLLAGCGAATLPPVHSETERLELGRRELQNRQYAAAIELLKGYVDKNAGGADVDQAIELLGECYLRTKEWGEAQTQFERLLRDYPESDSAGTAALRLGDALWGQARGPDFDQEYTEKALDQWKSYLRSYPGHWLNTVGEQRVQKARARLAEKLADTGILYIKLHRAAPARVYFERVLEEFADTTPAAQAALGMALADALEGKRDQAMAALRDVETRFAGRPEAKQATQELRHLERHDPKRKK